MRIVLPAALEERRNELAKKVVCAQRIVDEFAGQHGWSRHTVEPFFDRVEIYGRQDDLWRRIVAVLKLPVETPIPTSGLAAVLEERVLLAVGPEEYARVSPDYADAKGAYPRLLAHEIAHRLHIAILDGNEDAMGPRWFYEGFAAVAAGDLWSPPITCDQFWEYTSAEGPGAYRQYAAAVRFLMTRATLPELVEKAGRPGFEGWVEALSPK